MSSPEIELPSDNEMTPRSGWSWNSVSSIGRRPKRRERHLVSEGSPGRAVPRPLVRQFRKSGPVEGADRERRKRTSSVGGRHTSLERRSPAVSHVLRELTQQPSAIWVPSLDRPSTATGLRCGCLGAEPLEGEHSSIAFRHPTGKKHQHRGRPGRHGAFEHD